MFPLPLTSFEEYMFCDDRPAYPMSGVFRMRLQGFLDKASFEKAVATTIHRHPLTACTVRQSLLGRPKWIHHPDWLPPVHWNVPADPSGYPRICYINLSKEPGTRVFITSRNDGHDVFLQVHHACSDAIGGSLIMEDLLTSYALNTGTSAGMNISLRNIGLHQLSDRGAPGLTFRRLPGMLKQQLSGLNGIIKYCLNTPAALSGINPPVDDLVPPPTFPNPLAAEFDATETERIIATAKSAGMTVNDLLTRNLLVSLSEWRARHGQGRSDDLLRLFIPVNLRSDEEGQMPMANSISLVFIDRRGTDCAEPARLLEGIHKEMQYIKAHQLKYTFILALALLRLIPGLLRLATDSRQVIASCCFSNIGRALDTIPLPRQNGYIVAGNVTLESMDYVIPLRPNMNAAFVAWTYGSRLRLLLHFDPRTIPPDQARDLLETFMKHTSVQLFQRAPCPPPLARQQP